MHALVSSWKHNPVDQSTVMTSNKFDTQLIFQFHGARNLHASQLFRLIHHLVVELSVVLHEQRDAEDRSLR